MVTVRDIDETADFQEAFAISNRHKGKSNFRTALAILNNYLVFFCCAFVCEYAAAHHFHPKAWWLLYTLAALIIASRMRAFEHLVHEASHHNLFTGDPRWNDRLEFLYAFPVFRLLQAFRVLHLEHHKHLGDPIRDADVVRLAEYGFLSSTPISARRKAYLVFILPLTGWFQYEYFTTLFTEFWTSPTSYPSKLIYWASILSTIHLTHTWVPFLKYYVLPWLGILPVTRWWAEIGEHLGMDMRGAFGNSRTNDGFWQRWWIHPLNDGLHAAHHLNSQVPFHRLRDAHEELMVKSKAYKQKNVMAKGLWDTYRGINERTVVKERVEGVTASWASGLVYRRKEAMI